MITLKDGVWCIFSCCGRCSVFECEPEYIPLSENSLSWYKPVEDQWPLYDVVDGLAEIKKSKEYLEKEKYMALIRYTAREVKDFTTIEKTAEFYLNKFLEEYENR